MTEAVSSLPFLVEAFGYNKAIYPDIDRIYKRQKEKYYEAAKDHELYNHQIIKEGSLLQEEYCKKALGILLHVEEDPEVQNEISELIRKGWAYAYLFVKNCKQVNLNKFIANAVRKAGGINKVSDDWLNTQVFMAYFIARNMEKEVVESGVLTTLTEASIGRWKFYKWDNRIGTDPESRESARGLKDEVFQRYGRITDLNSAVTALPEVCDRLSLLFDFENLSFVSVADEVTFTEKETEECLLAFLARTPQPVNADAAAEFLCSAIYLRYLAKAYKVVKDQYFANNKETMYVEIAGLEKKLSGSQQEVSRLTKLLDDAAFVQRNQRKEIDRLQLQLKEEQQSRGELQGLREYLFSKDQQIEYPEDGIDIKILKEKQALIIGGHERWHTKMRDLLPKFVFISADQKNFDVRVLRVPVVFIYPNYLSHSVYFRAVEFIKGTDTRIVYLNQTNEDLVIREIAQYF